MKVVVIQTLKSKRVQTIFVSRVIVNIRDNECDGEFVALYLVHRMRGYE